MFSVNHFEWHLSDIVRYVVIIVLGQADGNSFLFLWEINDKDLNTIEPVSLNKVKNHVLVQDIMKLISNIMWCEFLFY